MSTSADQPHKANTLRLVRKAWQYVRAATGWRNGLNLAITLAQGILPLLFIWMMKLLIDQVIQVMGQGDSGHDLTPVIFLTLLTGLVFLASALCGIASGWLRSDQSLLLTEYMMGLIHKKASQLPLSYYEDPRYHDLFHRASSEASFRPARLVNGLFQLMQSMVSLGALTVLLVYLHWSIALALLLAGLPALIIRLRQARALYTWSYAKTGRERTLSYYHRILTGEAFARELRLFGHGKHIHDLFLTLGAALRKEKMGFYRRKALWDAAGQIFATAVIFGVLVWAVTLAVQGAMTTGTVVLFFLAFQRGAGFIRDLTESLAKLYDDQLYMQNLEDFLQLQPHLPKPQQGVDIQIHDATGIVFEKVSYAYPGRDKKVLDGVSFTLPEGKITALVGNNGAGKSTLVKLMCGLYLPDSGCIWVDGRDTRHWNPEALHNRFSVLFQDFVLYHLTAGENIWFGDPQTPYHVDALGVAAEKAGAKPLLQTFPQGFETLLGKIMGGNRQLSMGEWQKLALARAFYRDRPYLLLDEPGSALDPQAEAFVLERFQELCKDKTTLIISHRMTAARRSGHILVLDQGRLVEEGTHDQLMLQEGKYHALCLSSQ